MRKTTLSLIAASVGLLLMVGCSDDLPDLKYDVDGYMGKEQGVDFPPPPTLKACDLLITEFMAAPDNKDVEWIEILNTTSSEQDLSGLTIKMWSGGSAKERLVQLGKDTKTKVASGKRLVVCSCVKGTTASKELGCYSPPDCSKISLTNSPNVTTGYTISLKAGTTEVHKVVYGKTGGIAKAKSGSSTRLAGEITAAKMCAESANAKGWCNAPEEKTYDTAKKNAGSPGKANAGCCFYKPRTGDLRINEALPDAPGPEDQNEWVELFVASGPGPNGEVDLYGTRLLYGKAGTDSTALSTTDGSESCMRVKKGAYVLLTHKKKTASADTCTQDGTFNIGAVSLTGNAGYLGLIDADKKEIVTKVQYDPSNESTSIKGRAYNYDSTAKKWCWLAIDAKNKYCTVTTSGSKTEEGYGTPKAANVACP